MENPTSFGAGLGLAVGWRFPKGIFPAGFPFLPAGFPAESEEPSSLLQRAVAVLQSSYLDSTSQDGFQYSQAILVENDLFLSELKAFARAKEAAGYSPEELQETFAFLLFDKEEEAREVCQSGLRVNSSSISTLGDPAKGKIPKIPSWKTGIAIPGIGAPWKAEAKGQSSWCHPDFAAEIPGKSAFFLLLPADGDGIFPKEWQRSFTSPFRAFPPVGNSLCQPHADSWECS
ncbi:PREDICTED: protein FAM208B [Corvus brachyrhynchos]|uniref:protein FAM208B n=1 Tax=Corvus brachyrhynchos TaxID=85066 RepID=UPI0008167BC5|nr:PREDICTED: protein FAM208B [Corvus brachyrhynchos]